MTPAEREEMMEVFLNEEKKSCPHEYRGRLWDRYFLYVISVWDDPEVDFVKTFDEWLGD